MSKNNFVKKEILEEISSLFDFDAKHKVYTPETIEVKSIENAKIEIVKESMNNETIYLEDILIKLLKSEKCKETLIKAIQEKTNS